MFVGVNSVGMAHAAIGPAGTVVSTSRTAEVKRARVRVRLARQVLSCRLQCLRHVQSAATCGMNPSPAKSHRNRGGGEHDTDGHGDKSLHGNKMWLPVGGRSIAVHDLHRYLRRRSASKPRIIRPAPGPSGTPPGPRYPGRSSTESHPGSPLPSTRRDCRPPGSDRCGRRRRDRPRSSPQLQALPA